MKKNKKAILIILFIVVLLAIVGLVFAVNPVDTKATVTRPYSEVFFKEAEIDKNNEEEKDAYKKVDVYLGMHDTASVASFQIGLEIDMADCYDSSFKWNSRLTTEGEPTLNTERVTEQSKDETTGNMKERMNLYYVGTKELNHLKGNEDIDNFKVGTIYIKSHKDGDTAVTARNSGVAVQTIAQEGFSKTASLAHKSEEIKVEPDNAYIGEISINSAPSIASFDVKVETKVAEGGKSTPMITAYFEVLDNIESLTNIEIKLYKEGQDDPVDTKTITKEKINEQPVKFEDLEEGTYRVEAYMTYTTDDGHSDTKKIGEESNLQILPVDEPDDPSPEATTSPEASSSPEASTSPETSPTPETSASPEASSSPEASTSPEASSSPEASTSPEASSSPEITASPEATSSPEGGEGLSGGQNGWSANDSDKGKQTIVDKIVNSFKTGANHSITWIVVTLIVLMLVAIKIISVKKRHGKRYKK